MSKNKSEISFLIGSFLLQYPNAEWTDTLEEVLEEAKNLEQEDFAKPLLKFLNYAKGVKELDLAELYIRTFDFTKSTNLYLTYYEYKEDRKRGEALLSIKNRYREAGIRLNSSELPDFLPTVLEFTAVTGEEELLRRHISIIKNIYKVLSKDENPYSLVFEALLRILGESSLVDSERVEALGGAVQ